MWSFLPSAPLNAFSTLKCADNPALCGMLSKIPDLVGEFLLCHGLFFVHPSTLSGSSLKVSCEHQFYVEISCDCYNKLDLNQNTTLLNILSTTYTTLISYIFLSSI